MEEEWLSDLSEGSRGKREVPEGRAGLLLEGESATRTRERRESEVVDDETKEFRRKSKRHRR